jgi:drug/metabolite transporter (DMT)-like permease
MSNLIIALFNIVAFSVAALLIFVVGQALNNPHLKRNDPKEVKSQRKLSFFVAAALVMLSVIFQNYWLIHTSVVTTGLVVTLMLAGACWILAVSMVSMRLQKPRQPGGEAPHSLRRVLASFHNGIRR